MANINDALKTPSGVIATAKEWFDVDVPPELADLWASKYKKTMGRWTVSAGPLMWLKNRIGESLSFPCSCCCGLDAKFESCDLHTFFIFIEETEAMIELLRKNQTHSDSTVAQSRIFRELEVHNITPIDTVADRVAGE